jgi:solute carrier family 45, member 1/2/4
MGRTHVRFRFAFFREAQNYVTDKCEIRVGLGAVLGFFVGALPLPTFLPFFGDSQIKVLSVLASVILVAAHAVTCFAVTERVLVHLDDSHAEMGLGSNLRAIWVTFKGLPTPIWMICKAQCFSWMGWFPILFVCYL